MDSRADHRVEQLRIPPMSIEAEQSVLGGLMLAPGSYDRIADIITAEEFYRHDHQLIFRAISELAEKNKPYDAVTMGEWFDAHGLGEQVGDGAYLVELASTTPSAANIVAYADIVKDKAVLRRMIELGTGIVNHGFMPDGRDTSELLAEAESGVFALARDRRETTILPGLAGLKRTFAEMERRRAAGANLLGMESSLRELDRLTMGLQDGDLIILAARPSMGKSALMFQIMRHAAMIGKKPYGVSMEMSTEQVYMRHVAAVGQVDLNHVQLPAKADEDEHARIFSAFREMKGYEWWLDDTGSISVQKLATRIRRMKKQHDIGIVFVDYLQFIDISKAAKNGIPAAIQDVTRTLKQVAKELRIPIVLLSQLNRSLETRTDKRPGMADLRESGAIEQDADLIIFLHREGYFERDWSSDDPRQRVAELIVAKARNGIVGSARVEWLGKYQLFRDFIGDIPEGYDARRSKRGEAGFNPHPNNRPLMNPLTRLPGGSSMVVKYDD